MRALLKCWGTTSCYGPSTEYDDNHAWTMMLDMTQSGILRDYTGVTKDYGISVRCVKD